jgi:hypothetical protein
MRNSFTTWRMLSAVFLLLGVVALIPTTASAQLWFGGGLVYGAEIENLGIQANGHLVVNEENKLRIGADVTFFFPEKATAAGIEVKTNLFAINVNGHYMLVNAELLVLYAIGGLNLSFVTFDVDGPASELVFLNNGSETELGLNIGGGVEYEVPFGRIFGELKYVLGGFDQLEIAAGVRIPVAGGN